MIEIIMILIIIRISSKVYVEYYRSIALIISNLDPWPKNLNVEFFSITLGNLKLYFIVKNNLYTFYPFHLLSYN